jgi:hypothetical protein
MNDYNFTITLQPYGPGWGVVKIDPNAQYGYWEHKDGGEGGGLWFAGEAGALELADYDGTSDYLPTRVVRALQAAGFVVDESFNPDAYRPRYDEREYNPDNYHAI